MSSIEMPICIFSVLGFDYFLCAVLKRNSLQNFPSCKILPLHFTICCISSVCPVPLSTITDML